MLVPTYKQGWKKGKNWTRRCEKFSLSSTQMESNTADNYNDEQNQAEEHLTGGHDGVFLSLEDGIVL